MTQLSRRRLITAAGLLGAGLLAGCGAVDAGNRMLPRDRTADLLYVALGDSTATGVGASPLDWSYVNLLHRWLQNVYPSARLENLARDAVTAAEVASRQLDAAVRARPQLATLSVGLDDLAQLHSGSNVEGDLDRIVGGLARDTGAVIAVCLLPDLSLLPFFASAEQERAGEQARAYNEAIRQVGARYGVEVVDLYAASQEDLPTRPDLVSVDGYHPSNAGYVRWAELIWRAIEPHIPDA
jgi:lysophospholipase L1-like esterase